MYMYRLASYGTRTARLTELATRSPHPAVRVATLPSTGRSLSYWICGVQGGAGPGHVFVHSSRVSDDYTWSGIRCQHVRGKHDACSYKYTYMIADYYLHRWISKLDFVYPCT